MARNLSNIPIFIHYPSGMDKSQYHEQLDEFRMHYIKKTIARQPPRVQAAMLEWLEKNIRNND